MHDPMMIEKLRAAAQRFLQEMDYYDFGDVAPSHLAEQQTKAREDLATVLKAFDTTK